MRSKELKQLNRAGCSGGGGEHDDADTAKSTLNQPFRVCHFIYSYSAFVPDCRRFQMLDLNLVKFSFENI